jgi:hypothetical protein
MRQRYNNHSRVQKVRTRIQRHLPKVTKVIRKGKSAVAARTNSEQRLQRETSTLRRPCQDSISVWLSSHANAASYHLPKNTQPAPAAETVGPGAAVAAEAASILVAAADADTHTSPLAALMNSHTTRITTPIGVTPGSADPQRSSYGQLRTEATSRIDLSTQACPPGI